MVNTPGIRGAAFVVAHLVNEGLGPGLLVEVQVRVQVKFALLILADRTVGAISRLPPCFRRHSRESGKLVVRVSGEMLSPSDAVLPVQSVPGAPQERIRRIPRLVIAKIASV